MMSSKYSHKIPRAIIVSDMAKLERELHVLKQEVRQNATIPQAVLQMLAETDVIEDSWGVGETCCPVCKYRMSWTWKDGRRLDDPDQMIHHAACPIMWARMILDSEKFNAEIEHHPE